MKRGNIKAFIPLREAWGNHAIQSIQRDQRHKKKQFIESLFDIGVIRKVKGKVADILNKKNIIRVTCTANMFIPMTFFIVTNPIIKKVINSFDSDKIARKINVVKMMIQ